MTMATMRAEQNPPGEKLGKVRQSFREEVTLGLGLALAQERKWNQHIL